MPKTMALNSVERAYVPTHDAQPGTQNSSTSSALSRLTTRELRSKTGHSLSVLAPNELVGTFYMNASISPVREAHNGIGQDITRPGCQSCFSYDVSGRQDVIRGFALLRAIQARHYDAAGSPPFISTAANDVEFKSSTNWKSRRYIAGFQQDQLVNPTIPTAAQFAGCR